jgi:cyclopropane fatty-acyl-phospholipid synthase-like methyltransferase
VEVHVSRLTSILYSIFIARRRTYKPGSFEEGYFDRYRALTPEQRRDYYDKAGAYLRLLDPEPSKILDVGCGIGLLLDGFLAHGKDASGVEVSREALKFASKEAAARIRTGTLAEHGFRESEFDAVFCIDVLEHIPAGDAAGMISELVRVSRRHTILSICFWHERNARKDPTHINLRPKGYWNKLIRSMGLRTVPIPAGFPSADNSFIIVK